jgi:hypothetical protein
VIEPPGEKRNRSMKEDTLLSPERVELEERVAAHPFLLGMSDQHIRLLAD